MITFDEPDTYRDGWLPDGILAKIASKLSNPAETARLKTVCRFFNQEISYAQTPSTKFFTQKLAHGRDI